MLTGIMYVLVPMPYLFFGGGADTYGYSSIASGCAFHALRDERDGARGSMRPGDKLQRRRRVCTLRRRRARPAAGAAPGQSPPGARATHSARRRAPATSFPPSRPSDPPARRAAPRPAKQVGGRWQVPDWLFGGRVHRHPSHPRARPGDWARLHSALARGVFRESAPRAPAAMRSSLQERRGPVSSCGTHQPFMTSSPPSDARRRRACGRRSSPRARC